MKPEDEMRHLLESVIESMLDNVDKYGFAIPVCLGHNPVGERVYVVADSSDPDAVYDPAKCTESILHQVKRMVDEGQLRAIAFARNVKVTMASDKGPVET